MKGKEPEASATPPPDGAGEDLWQTYLDFDPRVQQAVARLGALSPENIVVFRSLLLEGRDRRRIKDYEAESIRRLQGDAFVDDMELQRTLIELNAEDPRFGEELLRQVAVSGKPAQLDRAVAAIRSVPPDVPVKERRKPVLVRLVERQASHAKSTAAKQAAAKTPQVKSPEPKRFETKPPETSPRPAPRTLASDTVVVPLRKEPVAPAQAALSDPPGRSRRSVVQACAIFLVTSPGLFYLVTGLVSGSITVDVRPITLPASTPPAHEEKPAAVRPKSSAPSTQTAHEEKPAAVRPQVVVRAPAQLAPGANAALQALPDGNLPAYASDAGPPLRPASSQPDGITAASPVLSAQPAAGARYIAKRGETVSDIARRAYGDAGKSRLIQAANPGLLSSPNRIAVDQVIFIPPDKP